MDRILLYVPFEEAGEAENAGALHDPDSKCWYIRPDQERQRFRRWLRRGMQAEDYTILSEDAYIAVTSTPCWRCGSPTEVICIYCASGEVCGQAHREFTVSNVTAIEPTLRQQLARWPNFRLVSRASAVERCFENHCDHCGAGQDDRFLHAEPGGVFFAPSTGSPASVQLVRLPGRVRFSGDEGFEPG